MTPLQERLDVSLLGRAKLEIQANGIADDILPRLAPPSRLDRVLAASSDNPAGAMAFGYAGALNEYERGGIRDNGPLVR